MKGMGYKASTSHKATHQMDANSLEDARNVKKMIEQKMIRYDAKCHGGKLSYEDICNYQDLFSTIEMCDFNENETTLLNELMMGNDIAFVAVCILRMNEFRVRKMYDNVCRMIADRAKAERLNIENQK